MPKKTRLTIATVNVNGIRAAVKNGMEGWVTERQPDIVTMQEIRAPDAMVSDLVRGITGPKWSVVHDECEFKGRAGVAVAAKKPITASRSGLKTHSKKNAKVYNDTGRWIEADLDTPDGKGLTVISAYVHTGDAEQPDKMKEKLAFMWAAKERLASLLASNRHVLLTGDLNVAHREFDIKNWKGNLKSAGFLPEERVWFDELFDEFGLVDVARQLSGDGPGPYSWWSWRGKAFDTDAGWRIDYHIASPGLADAALATSVDRAPSYAERWSDHAPVVVTYAL